MEAIPNGELFDLITAEGQAMTDGTRRRLVHGIINGMAELCALGDGDGGMCLGGWMRFHNPEVLPGIREWSKIWSNR